MRSQFATAYENGRYWAQTQILTGNYRVVVIAGTSPVEDLIFEATWNNPFKSEKAKADFVRGVEDRVEMYARNKTNLMMRGYSER